MFQNLLGRWLPVVTVFDLESAVAMSECLGWMGPFLRQILVIDSLQGKSISCSVVGSQPEGLADFAPG